MTSSIFVKLKSERAAKTFVKFSHFVLQLCKFFTSYCWLSISGKNGDNFCNTICNHADHKNWLFLKHFIFQIWIGIYQDVYILSNSSIHVSNSTKLQAQAQNSRLISLKPIYLRQFSYSTNFTDINESILPWNKGRIRPWITPNFASHNRHLRSKRRWKKKLKFEIRNLVGTEC